MTYEFDVCRDAKSFEVFASQLKSLRSRQKRPNVLQDPTWLQLQYSIRDDAEIAISVALINGKVVCAAPLIKETTDRYSWQLRLPGHDFTLARFHLRQVTLPCKRKPTRLLMIRKATHIPVDHAVLQQNLAQD